MPKDLIVAAATFERQGSASPEIMTDIVQAWDDALGAVLKRRVNWTLEAGDAAWSARTRPRIRRSQPQRFRGQAASTSAIDLAAVAWDPVALSYG